MTAPLINNRSTWADWLTILFSQAVQEENSLISESYFPICLAVAELADSLSSVKNLHGQLLGGYYSY